MSREINFQSLPSKAPNALPEKGIYLYEVKGTMIKAATNEYLEVRADISKGDGRKIATIYDRFFDTETDLNRFKLGQFMRALHLEEVGVFKLKDLLKVLQGRKCLVDIYIEKSRNTQYPDKAAVNPFTENIYYEIERAEELLGTAKSVSVETEKAIPSVSYLDKIDMEQNLDEEEY